VVTLITHQEVRTASLQAQATWIDELAWLIALAAHGPEVLHVHSREELKTMVTIFRPHQLTRGGKESGSERPVQLSRTRASLPSDASLKLAIQIALVESLIISYQTQYKWNINQSMRRMQRDDSAMIVSTKD
jgi:hypothetical protein